MSELIDQSKAEIVHIHNFFPLLTPAVHAESAKRGLAVVQTLHNYRLLCANGLFLREGSVCEKCLNGSKVWGVVHRCYRNSLPGSIAVARMYLRADRNRTWNSHVHRFIALTNFAKEKFVLGGLPSDKIAVKPNFVSMASKRPSQRARRGALFVGRLSPEKGVETLLRAFDRLKEIPLTVVGSGPGMERLKSLAPQGVVFAGQLSPEQVREEMMRAQCLVVPSICFEGFPMTAIEAFAAGLPVVASRIGSLHEIVVEDVSGAHFTPGDAEDLAGVLSRLFAEPARLEELGAGARAYYEANYTPDRNLRQLEAIYTDALEAARADQRVM